MMFTALGNASNDSLPRILIATVSGSSVNICHCYFFVYIKALRFAQFIHTIIQRIGIFYHCQDQKLQYGTTQHYNPAHAQHNKLSQQLQCTKSQTTGLYQAYGCG